MNLNSRGNAVLLCALLLLPIAFSVQAEGQPTAPSITTAWTDDEGSGIRHAYTLTFADQEAYEVNVSLDHRRDGVALANEALITWQVENDLRTADIEFNTSLQWGDEIELLATITSMNGVALEQPVSTSRELTVGTWNQPMALSLIHI